MRGLDQFYTQKNIKKGELTTMDTDDHISMYLTNVLKQNSASNSNEPETGRFMTIPELSRPDGQFTLEFQEFFNRVSDVFIEGDLTALYNVSDKIFDNREDFNKLIIKKFHPTWDSYLNCTRNRRGLNIEVNYARLNSMFGRLIGSFRVTFYTIVDVQSDISDCITTKLNQYSTEIYFKHTYGRFQVISVFDPFVKYDV